jgi:pSer/pThr/pTyr-binding forkhead associated (FHA) protein
MGTVAVRLIIEDLEGATTVVNLGTEDVTIGRKPHNTIQLTEQNVSRSHAKLTFRDDAWLVQDLASYNGVKVNGIPITQPTLLRESDLIQIGDYHLTLTDDVDRATVDIERPRPAANDGYSSGGAMVSSSDLPSMSIDDLEPKRAPVPMAIPAPRSEEKPSKVGLILGIVGALAAVIGIGVFLAMNSAQEGEKTQDEGKTQAAKQPEPPVSTTGPVNTTGPEPVPEPPADTGADTGAAADTGVAAETAGAETGGAADTAAPTDSGGEVMAETGAEEPEPQTSPDPKPKPITKPKLPPDQALAEARKASLQGNNSKAYSLAKDAYDQNQSGDALNLMGVAACKMGSATKAKSAHRKMTATDKAKLEKLCSSVGVEL